MKRGRQGRIFRIRLGEKGLSLWMFGVLPLGWVSLQKVDWIQQRDIAEFWSFNPKRVFMPWRYWYWPSSPGKGGPKAGMFLIQTVSGTRIWLRLRSGLHYQLREAVHRNQTGLE